MTQFTVQPDAKLPGTFRVIDPEGHHVTAAIPRSMADRIATRRNYELNRKADPGQPNTIRIVSVILAVITILGCLQMLGWDDAKTYSLNHGSENFDQ